MKTLAVGLAVTLCLLLCHQVASLALELTASEDGSQPNKTSSSSGLRLPVQTGVIRDYQIAETFPTPPALACTPLQLGYFYVTQFSYFWKLISVDVVDPPLEFLSQGFPTLQMYYRNDPEAGAPFFTTTDAMYASLRIIQTEVNSERNTWYPKNFVVNKNGRRIGNIHTTMIQIAASRAPGRLDSPANISQAGVVNDTHTLQIQDASVAANNMSKTEKTSITQSRTVMLPHNLGNTDFRFRYVDNERVLGRQLLTVITSYIVGFATWRYSDAAFTHLRPGCRYWQVDGAYPTLYARMILPAQRPMAPLIRVENVVDCLQFVLEDATMRWQLFGFEASCSNPNQDPWMTLLVTVIRPNPGPPRPPPGPSGLPGTNDEFLFPSIAESVI